jgi:hypothetical protein
MSYDPIEFLGLNCFTDDAEFYICGRDSTNPGGTFLGCCTTDPCANNTCPEGNLRTAGFNASQYNYIMPQKCADDNAAWWTCAWGSTYMGCCESNACQGDGRCSDSESVDVLMSDERQFQLAFFQQPDPTTASTASNTATGTPSETSDNDGDEGGGGGNNNTAVHAAVGAVCGVVGLLLIAGAIVFFLRRKRRQTSPPVDLPPAWRSDNAADQPPPPFTSAISPTIAPSSPFLPDGSPMSPLAKTHTDKNGAIYPSGVSSLSSQGYNPAHGVPTSPSASPYGTPYASPAPNQTEFAHRQSVYSQGYSMPGSPSPTQPMFVGHNNYQGPTTFAAELPASESERK